MEGGGAAPEPPEEEGNRALNNAVMLGFLGVGWQRESGCATIEFPTGRDIDAFSETGEAR